VPIAHLPSDVSPEEVGAYVGRDGAVVVEGVASAVLLDRIESELPPPALDQPGINTPALVPRHHRPGPNCRRCWRSRRGVAGRLASGVHQPARLVRHADLDGRRNRSG